MLTLYQAEWCPHSHKVRQRLTELGLDFVAKQVEPKAEDRDVLRTVTGTDEIPVLVTEDGEAIDVDDRIIEWLDARYPEPETAKGHRAQLRAHS